MVMDQLKEASDALGCELAVEVVRAFGKLRMRATGTSMVPAVQPGDILSIQRANTSEISPGEIVLFARGGRLFAHRVLSTAGSSAQPCLITRGDRLPQNDPPVFASHLLGRVVSISRSRRQIVPRARLSKPQRVACRLLWSSDRATYLYLCLTAFWRELVTKAIACRA